MENGSSVEIGSDAITGILNVVTGNWES